MIKFLAKIGAVGSAGYYLSSKGVWGDTTKTTQLYNNMCDFTKPYVNQIESKLPFELPALPDRQRVSFLGVYYWNRAVMSTFKFLSNLPAKTKEMTANIAYNDGVKQFIASFSKS